MSRVTQEAIVYMTPTLTVRMVCVCLNIATIFTPSFRGGLQKIVRVFLKEHCEKRKYVFHDPSL